MPAPVSLAFRIAGNLEALRANLAEAKSQIETTKKALQTMANSLDGSKLIADANAMVKAVSDLGGVSRLTEAEQKRVNQTVSEALTKYQALGKEAPAALYALQAQTAQVVYTVEQLPPAVQKSSGAFQSLFGQFTAANLASSAIQSLGAGVMEFVKQGAKLPAIEQSFQRLSGGIKQNSGEMLSNMRTATKSMVSDLDLMQSANKAMLLGLPVTAQSMGDLAKTAMVLGKAMGQDATKSFDDLITALGRSSPMILDNLGLTVKVGEANEEYARKLGKTAEQLTQSEQKMAFYQAAMEAARKKTKELGDQTMTLGEMAQSTWTRVGNAVSGAAADINVGVGRAMSSSKEFALFLGDVAKQGIGGAIAMAALREQIAAAAAAAKAPKPESPLAAVQAMIDFQRAAEKARVDGLIPLTASQREFVIATNAGGKSAQEIATALGISERAVSAFLDANKKSAEEIKKHAEAIADLAAKYTGAKLATQISDIGEAMKKMGRGADWKSLAEDLAKLQQEGAKLTPEMQQLVIKFGLLGPAAKDGMEGITGFGEAVRLTIPVVNQLAEQSGLLQAKVKASFDGFGDIGFKVESGFGKGAEAIEKGAKQDQRAIDELAKSFGTLATIAGDSLGGIVRDLALIVAAADTAQKSIASIQKGKKDKGFLGFMEETAGLIGLASAAIQAGKAIANLFDRNKGRDLVSDFAKSMGGFDALQAKLMALPEGGEKLWIALTQGVGRNNPEEAKRAIEAVQAALDKVQNTSPLSLAAAAGYQTRAELQAIADKARQVYEYMRDSGLYTADAIADAFKKMSEAQIAAMDDAGRAAVDAATKARDAAQKVVDELAGQIKSLQEAIDAEAPEEVMGAMEAQNRARLEALRKQQEEAQTKVDDLNKQIKDATDAAVAAAKEAASQAGAATVSAIRGALSAAQFRVRVKVDLDGLPPTGGSGGGGGGGGSEYGGPQAEGGDYYVTKPTWFLAGEKPGGERATFSGAGRTAFPGSSQQGGGGDEYLPVQLVMPDGSVLIEQLVKVARREGYL